MNSTDICLLNTSIFSSWLMHLMSHIDMPSLSLTLVPFVSKQKEMCDYFHANKHWRATSISFSSFSEGHSLTFIWLSECHYGRSEPGWSCGALNTVKKPQERPLATQTPPRPPPSWKIPLFEWDQLHFWREAAYPGLLEAWCFNCWSCSCYFLALGFSHVLWPSRLSVFLSEDNNSTYSMA